MAKAQKVGGGQIGEGYQAQIKTRLYSIKEASELWNVPINVLYDEIRQGRLKAVMRRGCVRGYLVTEQIMSDWVENSMVDVYEVKGGLV